MYKELGIFVRSVVTQRSVWKDGDLVTAAVVFAACILGLRQRPDLIPSIRAHFGEVLTMISIMFGFSLTSLAFYVSAIANWSSDEDSSWRTDERVRKVSKKLVDWNVWTILWLLFALVYIIVLWIFDQHAPTDKSWPRVCWYGGAAFIASYALGQIVNHVLTLSWFHDRIDRFAGPKKA